MRGGGHGLRKPRVYIAGPISKGNQFHNCADGILANRLVMMLGGTPFCPHLSMLTDVVCHAMSKLEPEYEVTYDEWLQMDFEWIDVCDVLLRLPGESKGADMEVEHARNRDIKVVFGLEELPLAIREFHEERKAGSHISA